MQDEYRVLHLIKKMLEKVGNLNAVPITQAEYDALVADGKVDNKVFYMIIDEGDA